MIVARFVELDSALGATTNSPNIIQGVLFLKISIFVAMSCAVLPTSKVESLIDDSETCSVVNNGAQGIDQVVQLTVIGLTGIILDSTKTKETVSKDKNMLIPPRHMKASLVVIRDDKLYGTSSLSRGLIQSNAATSSVESNELAGRKQRRYLAIWNNSRATNDPSSILFEAKISENSSCAPHRNFDLFIGLTACVDSTTTTIPIGVASLPLAEAVALQGPSGKVVLDLPVYNISPVQLASSKAFSNSVAVNGNAEETNRKTKRGLFFGFRKRQSTRELAIVKADVSTALISKKPCIYTLDTTQEDCAILRVELELQQKESNFEIAMDSLPFSESLFADDITEVHNISAVVDDRSYSSSNPAIETSVDDTYLEEQSFERVLSIRSTHPTSIKSQFQINAIRRFRVKCIDRTSSKFELTPVEKKYPEYTYKDENLEQEESVLAYRENADTSNCLADVAIERMLSGQPTYDDNDTLMVALAHCNEDETSVFYNEISLDEQSFLSRDTTAFQSKKKTKNTKFVKSDKKLETTPKPLKLPLFWRRSSKDTISDVKNMSSVDGTETSNHSSSNSDNTSTSPNRNIENDQELSCVDRLISVSSNSEIICETPVRTSASVSPKRSPVKVPVSILRTPSSSKHKAKEPMSPLSESSSENLQDLDVFIMSPVKTNNDGSSVVSSSAETDVCKTVPPSKIDMKITEGVEAFNEEVTTSAHVWDASASVKPSTYSNSLPHFVEEATRPIVLQEKYLLDENDDILNHTSPYAHIFNPNEASCSTNGGFALREKPVAPRNMAQNFYRFMDLQSCAVKLDPLLAIDEEDFTIAESWTHNENSTLGTYEPPKETMHDDLADLGLLLDDMCRQSGFRVRSDDFSIIDDGTARETFTASLLDRNGGKQRWISALGSNVRVSLTDSISKAKRKASSRRLRTNADEDSNFEELSSSVHSSSERSSEVSADEHTLKSSTEECESLLSEQGTEIDVKDVDLVPHEPNATSKEFLAHHVSAKSPSSNLKSLSRRLLREHGKNLYGKTPEPTNDIQPISQTRYKAGMDKQESPEPMPDSEAPIKTTLMTTTKSSQLPPKDPNRKAQSHIVLETNSKVLSPVLGEESNGSHNNSLSPSRKSIAQSFVDFVEYVITPSPSTTPISQIPTILEGDDTASVGELTATTYERQIEVDEMRRRSAEHPTLQIISVIPSINDTYFAEYDGVVGPDVAAALEAAAAKKSAEGQVGHQP